MTIQKEFADKVIEVVKNNEKILGVAVAGSWLTNETDEFSDLDLILVTSEKIGGNKARMIEFAENFPYFLSGFTGEHVGEPRVLICLYDNPLLHVDLKFVTLAEFPHNVETPVILLDRERLLSDSLKGSKPQFPYPDYQWIEDRFWIWVHYTLSKIGRGEYVEAYDFFGFLRMIVFGPLLHIKNGNLPRGVRRVETQLSSPDLIQLLGTLPTYSRMSLLNSLHNAVILYRQLREELYASAIMLQTSTEKKVMDYFKIIEQL